MQLVIPVIAISLSQTVYLTGNNTATILLAFLTFPQIYLPMYRIYLLLQFLPLQPFTFLLGSHYHFVLHSVAITCVHKPFILPLIKLWHGEVRVSEWKVLEISARNAGEVVMSRKVMVV